MLKSLEFLECGLVRPNSFRSAITLNRVIDLELSNHSSLEPCHTAGVRSLDIDKIDERYLLSGGKNGALYIHDLLNSTGRASYVSKAVCKIPYVPPFSKWLLPFAY
ncbi:DNA excision repair protein ERCC-8-like [Stegodyphus dumicola]|uniref:DNA excision repair protein ERCC-8-like n=1 Tax=Stegodyphus dumicola TaxID=202533 RepID=UPI0015A7DCE6|nr:DNA excision repair protein ERCC-8-like [Stegodyphus dumicola]